MTESKLGTRSDSEARMAQSDRGMRRVVPRTSLPRPDDTNDMDIAEERSEIREKNRNWARTVIFGLRTNDS